jgi:hypothetical protein
MPASAGMVTGTSIEKNQGINRHFLAFRPFRLAFGAAGSRAFPGLGKGSEAVSVPIRSFASWGGAEHHPSPSFA